MELMTYITHQIGAGINSKEWSRAIYAFNHISNKTIEEVNCTSCKACKISCTNEQGSNVTAPTLGVIAATETGLVIICPIKDNVPIAVLLNKNAIRVVSFQKKLLNGIVEITTSNGKYILTVGKNDEKTYMTLINSVRMS